MPFKYDLQAVTDLLIDGLGDSGIEEIADALSEGDALEAKQDLSLRERAQHLVDQAVQAGRITGLIGTIAARCDLQVTIKLISEAFNNDDLDTLAFTLFKQLYDDLGQGVSKSKKSRRIVDYALSQGHIAELFAYVKRENPFQYHRYIKDAFGSQRRSPPPTSPICRVIGDRPLWHLFGSWFVTLVGALEGVASLLDVPPCPRRLALAILFGLSGLFLVGASIWCRRPHSRWDWGVTLTLMVGSTAVFGYLATVGCTCSGACCLEPEVSLHSSRDRLRPGETAELTVKYEGAAGAAPEFLWSASEAGLGYEGGPHYSYQNSYTAPDSAVGQIVRITLQANDPTCEKRSETQAEIRVMSITVTPTASPSVSPSPTASGTPADTATPTPTGTITATASPSHTPTVTSTPTLTPTQTRRPWTPSPTFTPTPTFTVEAQPPGNGGSEEPPTKKPPQP